MWYMPLFTNKFLHRTNNVIFLCKKTQRTAFDIRTQTKEKYYYNILLPFLALQTPLFWGVLSHSVYKFFSVSSDLPNLERFKNLSLGSLWTQLFRSVITAQSNHDGSSFFFLKPISNLQQPVLDLDLSGVVSHHTSSLFFHSSKLFGFF